MMPCDPTPELQDLQREQQEQLLLEQLTEQLEEVREQQARARAWEQSWSRRSSNQVRSEIDRAIAGLGPRHASSPIEQPAQKTTNPVKPIKSKDWILLHARQWKKAGKINDGTTQDTLAKMIADELSAARARGVPIRALKQHSIRSHLTYYGVWPISVIK
jgi:hypothetical protein